MDTPERPSRFLRFIRWALINAVVTGALLALLEGAASFYMAHRMIGEKPRTETDQRIVAERMHTDYDPLLGWVNKSDTVVSNMYGEGRHLTINSNGFRGVEGSNGIVRMIVSGNSFTFGYGVGDENTWSEKLEDLTPGLEVINMGLGGYGVGQAFLWYQRDGQNLDHDIHLFCFITENFRRMGRDRFMGYGKPVLTARDGKLVVENVPPPKPRKSIVPERISRALSDLHIARLIAGWTEKKQAELQATRESKIEEAALLAFTELEKIHAKDSRPWALVYFPVESDYRDGHSNGWRKWLSKEAKERNWIFLDLVGELRKLPKNEISGLFIQSDEGRYRGSKGHFTEAGNAWAAETLHRLLREQPAMIARLDGIPRQ